MTTLKTFVAEHKQSLIIGGWVLVAALFLIGLFIYNNPPYIVYQPADACKLFTPAEAENLLGDHVSNVDTDKPVISGDVATSQCGYGDTNPNQDQRKVAAVAIRSGINDKGVKKNKAEYKTGKSSQTNIAEIDNLGDDAYFNHVNGQLNVLDGRRWFIISYGVGSTPQENTIEDAVTLANVVLGSRQSTLPQF